MRVLNLIVMSIFTFLLQVQPVVSQTIFKGKILSVDGTPIPKTAISIRPEIQRDIFSGHYEDVIAADDGSYQFQINEPGLYRIIFKGVFHSGISLPVMIYDQAAMTMNVLLMPKYFNDGYYFARNDYIKWIRVYGNFNDYNYNTGKKFTLNPDGSISAFIPVRSDTIKYQVSGLTYGRGSSVLPQADEFQVYKDGSFEAVLFNNLPEDSLEIRYDPGQTIPFKRHFPSKHHVPEGINPQRIAFGGFVSFQNQENENWIRPLSVIQPYSRLFEFTDWEMSSGIPVHTQKEVQSEHAGNIWDADFDETLKIIQTELNRTNLHPQQKALLSMSYASVLGWMARKTMFQQMRRRHLEQPEEIPNVEHDSEILRTIPETVPPFHPAWRYNNGAVDYLLTETEDSQKFVEYFHEAVKVHPDERAVYVIALTLVRHFCSEFSSVEEMPVYQLIIDRYGEGDLARNAHQAFMAGTRN